MPECRYCGYQGEIETMWGNEFCPECGEMWLWDHLEEITDDDN